MITPDVNIHKVLLAIRQLEDHPAVKAYITLQDALKLAAKEQQESRK